MQSSNDDQIPAIVQALYLIPLSHMGMVTMTRSDLEGNMIFSLSLDFNVS